MGCGGGGGGGGGGIPPTQPPVPPPGAAFTPAGPTGANSISLATGQGGSATVFVLDVDATGVSDVYGFSFDLEYPSKLMDLRTRKINEGSFLPGPDDVRTELVVEERPAGNLVIGYSRIGQVGGADGSGLLFSLEFALIGNGRGPLTLERTDVIDPFGETQSGVSWIGGSIQVAVQ